MRPVIEFEEKDHKYRVNGVIVPSVTQILDASVPKQLGWWGMQVGVAGVVELYHQGKISSWEADDIVKLLTENKMTVNHRRDARGSVGQQLHRDLEQYAATGDLPQRKYYAEEDFPRVDALRAWLSCNEPKFLQSEGITASEEYQYAGTFDGKVEMQQGEYKDAYVLIDLKSSKYIYPDSHWPQLEAYEYAELECGEEPTDFRAVLHLPPIGKAVLSVSTDTFEQFRILKQHYDTVQDRKRRMKEAKEYLKSSNQGIRK